MSSPPPTRPASGPCSPTRRDDLLTDTVTGTLDDLAGQDNDADAAAAAERARALLDLARSGDAEPVLDALAEPARFPGLLQIAGRPR